MIFEQYIPTLIQAVVSCGGFIFILGRHKQILEHNGKLLEKQEQAIKSIVDRLDNMNSELNFIKGVFYCKNKE